MVNPRAILVVEDDRFFMEDIRDGLRDRGLGAIETTNECQALDTLATRADAIAVALLDVRFGYDEGDDAGTATGRRAGLRLARHIRENHPQIRVIGMSLGPEERIRNWFIEYGYAFLEKSWLNGGAERQFFDVIERAAREGEALRKPNVFVVHGRDTSSLHELLHFLSRSLHWDTPQILREMPGCGRTIIERFEDVARNVDLVFVLLTPDDVAISADQPNELKRRARQNVIFEMGYFFAKLQRTGGRLILLYKGDIELPSDISGVTYVDISRGIIASGESIRREVSAWL